MSGTLLGSCASAASGAARRATASRVTAKRFMGHRWPACYGVRRGEVNGHTTEHTTGSVPAWARSHACSPVTALYEEREGGNVVMVIEGQSDDE